MNDVRCFIGSKIEDKYEFLRRDWLGSREGLQIDSFKKIHYVDGYKTNLKNIENEESKNNIFISKNVPRMNL